MLLYTWIWVPRLSCDWTYDIEILSADQKCVSWIELNMFYCFNIQWIGYKFLQLRKTSPCTCTCELSTVKIERGIATDSVENFNSCTINIFLITRENVHVILQIKREIQTQIIYYVNLIRYQFWCTRCAFRLIKSLQWYSDRKKGGRPKKICDNCIRAWKNPNTVPWNWAKSVEG
jgi:hypothetical protein